MKPACLKLIAGNCVRDYHLTEPIYAALSVAPAWVLHSLRIGKKARTSTDSQQSAYGKITQLLNSPLVQPTGDFESFKQQESTFLLLNLFVLAILLLIHTLFAWHWGDPSKSLIAILACAFVTQGAELIWLQLRALPLGQGAIASLSWVSIGFNIILALVLAEVTSRPDTQYFILLVIPILVAAFRLTLLPTLTVVGLVDITDFFWVWQYGRKTPSSPISEYFEAMTVSLIYLVVGILVWALVNNLRQKEKKLSQSLDDLEKARAKALREEKLAAVGRLSSAIAHEIRNPVAAIVSALSTAKQDGLDPEARREMFDIAGKEAQRLEELTTDFLAYARPRNPDKAICSVGDTLGYVADVCRPRASEKGVFVYAETPIELRAEMDAGQVQQALINIVVNALEASPPGAHIRLWAETEGGGTIRVAVENDGDAVPAQDVKHLFEPFFTTKPNGTGLGLAIARNIALAHAGDLTLDVNQPGRVRFGMTLPAAANAELREKLWVES